MFILIAKLVPSSLWLASQDFSCGVVTMAGFSGLFLCRRHCGWHLGTFKLKLNLAGTGALILLHFQ
eukprot:scaffold38109_cov45-Attheya_sp.AAC.1